MATSISAIIVPCLKSFNELQEQVERLDYSREAEVTAASWGDELGRLRVWAANIGAHQTGQSSLDFRLRDASHISKQVIKLLRDLEQSLRDILEELSGDRTDALEDDEPWPGEESTTELQQLHEEVFNIIDCLYQLSMLIRKPAEHDMLIGSRAGDMTQFEFYDREHVRNLHPSTEEQVGQRLGSAITRRRKYLLYRERHHKKLEKGMEKVQGIQRTTTGSVLSETIATDFQTPNIEFEETSSNSGISQTSYAPSLVDGGRVTVPPPPRNSVGGKPFECPYCFFVIDIRSTRSWHRHIFKDIKPYVCTFPKCSMPDRLYDSRREWYFHESTEHRREDWVCSLCRDTLKSSKQYERHVARHLEELALFALPRIESDDAEDDNDDGAEAKISTSENDAVSDSLSQGSSVEVEEGKTSLKFETQTLPPLSSLARAEAAVAAGIDKADKEDRPAADTDERSITFFDALGRRFNFPFNAVNTWSGMEHLIKEIFLVVPNLTWRVAEGQYDLCGPQDEILSPYNWESIIKPGWEITMRMWPNPERPPREYAGPSAMLQDRHDIRLGKQDEPSRRLVSQQEENDLYDSEHPPLGELKRYRTEGSTTQHVGGIRVEEQGPQARSEFHGEPLNLVSGHSQDSEEWKEDHATNVVHTYPGNPRLREPKAHHRRKPTTELVSDIVVEERRPRTYARPLRLSRRGNVSESDERDEEYTTLKDQEVLYEHSEIPQSRELGPYPDRRADSRTGFRKSLLPRGSLYETDMKERERRLERNGSSASVRTRTMGYNTRADNRYHE